jgi:hypothetical protein
MYCVSIEYKNLNLLKEFIGNNKNDNFRYYDNREFECIKNHISTNLYYEGDICVGYGHLDFEDKLWLGILVDSNYKGKGYGDLILDDLISKSKIDIHLTVDKDNLIAKALYLKKNFEILEEKENHFLMIKKMS